MDINSNGVSITVSDKSTVDYEGVSLIGTGYNNLDNPSRTIGKLLNQNFLNLASKIKSLFVSLDTKADKTTTYTKTDVDTAIDDRISFLIGSAPQNLDTLYEIAQRLGEDDTKIAQMLDLIASKADKTSLGLHYSASEVQTNDVWIDGKPIYAKTFELPNLTSSSSRAVSVDFSFVDKFVRPLDYSYMRTDGLFQSSSVSSVASNIYCQLTSSLIAYAAAAATSYVHLTVYYTKK